MSEKFPPDGEANERANRARTTSATSKDFFSAPVSRRGFLGRAAGIGAGAVAGSALLSACSSASDSAPAATAAASAAESPSAPAPAGSISDSFKNKTIGVPVYTYADENEPLIAAQLEAAAAAAGLNWTFLIEDTQADQALAEQVVDSFITRGVDAIVDIIVSPRSIAPQLARAKEQEIPVFGIYNFAPLEENFVVDYGGSTAVDGTYIASYMIADQVARHPGRKIKLGILNTDLDVLRPRRGVLDGLLSLPEAQEAFEIVGVKEVDPGDVVASATSGTQALISQAPDLDAIWSSLSPAAMVSATAVEQVGAQDQVACYGCIAGSAGLEALQSGTSPLVATSWADLVYVSWGTVDLMLQHFSGQEVDRLASLTTNPLPYTTVTPRVAQGPDVQPVATLGGEEVLTWMYAAGAYRDAFVRSWQTTYA